MSGYDLAAILLSAMNRTVSLTVLSLALTRQARLSLVEFALRTKSYSPQAYDRSTSGSACRVVVIAGDGWRLWAAMGDGALTV